MIHYTCDRCHRAINREEELRFEVTIVTEVKFDGADGAGASGNNELLDEINAMLGQVVDSANQELFCTRRYDLCSECYQEYVGNPLGADGHAVQVGFSKN